MHQNSSQRSTLKKQSKNLQEYTTQKTPLNIVKYNGAWLRKFNSHEIRKLHIDK